MAVRQPQPLPPKTSPTHRLLSPVPPLPPVDPVPPVPPVPPVLPVTPVPPVDPVPPVEPVCNLIVLVYNCKKSIISK